MTTSAISVPKQFSEGSPVEWFQRFEICSNANGWEDEAKAKRLPTLLEGEALAVWLELSEAEQKDYKVAKAKILERMSPVRFISMDDFHRHRLLHGESLSVFIHELKRLLDQAMPDADAQTRKQLLIHQFLTGIPVEVSKQLPAAGEIDDLDRLMQRAKLLMTLDYSEKTAAAVEKQQMDAVEALKEQVIALTEQVAALTTQQNPRQSPRQPASLQCFHCNQLGHVQRNCPNKFRQCYSCGRNGHIASECRSGNGSRAPRSGLGRPQRQ